MKFRFGLLPRVVLAIGLGGGCGFFFPVWATRIALTFNDIFGQFLSFVIPLLILGLVAPGIADLGRNAGRLLALTAALAYAFTLFSGFGTYLTGRALFPALLEGAAAVLPDAAATAPAPYFTVGMPPLFGVMSALVLAFVLGLGMAYTHSVKLKGVMDDFKSIIDRVIAGVIIPLLPFYIFGIFLSMTQSGQVAGVLGVFVKLIVVIFFMTVVLLLAQFSIAGLVARKNPLRVHPVRCKRAERKERRLRPGLLRGGAVRAHPAAPAPGQPEAGAVHSHRGPDEPDHLFAEGDHPGGGASGGAACAGKGEVR